MVNATVMQVVPEKNLKGLAAIEQAKAFNITTPEQAAFVDAFCVGLKGLEKEIDATFDPNIESWHRGHKEAVASKKKFSEPVLEARAIAKGKLIAWSDAQAKIAEQEAAIARAKAKQDAEDEALARAARAAEFGDDKTAEQIINAPVVVEPVKVAAPVKTATVMQTRWKFRIVNAALVPREYLTIDETKIGGVIRATKGSITIPGVEAFSERC